ncbi:MAG: helix-turn-helix domain-containing protein [Clostridia bacterium]
MDYAILGENIRICRETKGLTQEKLAELSELSAKHISKIELGKINIKVETLIKIANALNVTIDTLLRNFLGNNNDLYTLEINRYIEMLSEEEKARLLWHLQKSKEFDERKNKLML